MESCPEGSDPKVVDMLNTISAQLSQLLTLPEIVSHMQTQLLSIQSENATIHTKLTGMDSKLNKVEAENNALRNEVEQLRIALLDNLQYQRQQNLIISNIPLHEPNEKEEKTRELVNTLMNKLAIEVQPWDIIRAHRLQARKPRSGNSPPEPPLVIVKFHNPDTKKAAISASITIKPTTEIFGAQSSSSARIYLNEQLTRESQSLFSNARFRLIKDPPAHLKFYSVKHRDGKIMAKRTETARPVKITRIEDIDRLVPAYSNGNMTQT